MRISGVSSMYNVIVHYWNSFLLCLIRYLNLAFLRRLFTMKIDDFFPVFTSFNCQWSFSMKAITENQLHDFNSGYSFKKYCLHNSTLLGITITAVPRIKFGLRKGSSTKHPGQKPSDIYLDKTPGQTLPPSKILCFIFLKFSWFLKCSGY